MKRAIRGRGRDPLREIVGAGELRGEVAFFAVASAARAFTHVVSPRDWEVVFFDGIWGWDVPPLRGGTVPLPCSA